MKILVISCDKYGDTFEPFHHCMEKYWPDHPEIFYSTETVKNPYYETICKNSEWTDRVSYAVQNIDDDYILMMCDDVFIRESVNNERIKYIENSVKNLDDFCQLTFISEVRNRPDLIIKQLDDYVNIGIKIRDPYCNSVNCSLWKKEMLMKCLTGRPINVWEFECDRSRFNGKYYVSINADWPIKWGRENGKRVIGLVKGKWTNECVNFLTNEGLNIDFYKRGVIIGE